MVYIIAVFRSRKETMDLRARLESNMIKCQTINTPRPVSVGCGISLKYDSRGYNCAKKIINTSCYHTFVGFFTYDEDGKLVSV